MPSSRPPITVGVCLTAALALLAACGTDPDPAASAAPSASASGSAAPSASPTPAKVPTSRNLNEITVTGDYGEAPKVTFEAPWAVDKTRTEVLSPGQGAKVADGQSVQVNYAGYNARTGKMFDSSFERGEPATFALDNVVPGFKKGLVGQQQGSRVLIAMPGSDGYDGSGGNPQIDVQVGDTLIFVVDMVGVQLAAAEGEAVPPKDGLPTVTVAKGVPTVTMPKTDPPKELQVQPLIKGAGSKVAEGDEVTFRHRWYTWDGKLVEDSYTAAEPVSYPLSGLIPGIAKGLVNQTVGSQVLLVVPPADGYPNGNEDPKIEKGATLVFVFDILFTQPQQ